MQQVKSTNVIEIVKSPNDFRSYRVVILPNGITSLLISTALPSGGDYREDINSYQPDSMEVEYFEDGEAGAALCLGIGSFSDPREIPGFAHFMEHMVFMGSKKYPKENHWDDFLAKNGGESNAWTDCERTCFFFVVNQDSFSKALDIFAQFFISPLFNKNSVDREIIAVDNECQLLSSNDSERTRNVIAHLVVEEGNPMKKFMAGNKKSLQEDPEKYNINVYSQLDTFYKQMYTAQYMTLVVHSMEDLDTIENKVIKIFSKIPNNQIPHPKFIKPPFQEKNFNKFIKVVPVEDVHKLDMMWAFPSLKDHYKTRIIEFLAVLMGHEGKGSILSVLKKKHYALEIAAGNDMTGYTHNSTCTTFLVSIKLTDQGTKAVDEVLETVFQYINLLKENLPAYVFEEQKHIEETKYIFQDQEAVYNTVEEVAENMHTFPPEHYLCGRKLFFEYNEQLIRDCVYFLRPQGVLILQYDKNFNSYPNWKEEPWFGTKYKMSDIDHALMYKLINLEPNPDLKLPEPNPYISTNFNILKGKKVTKHPVVIYNEDGCRMWFKKDNQFSTPKAFVYFNMISPSLSRTSKNLALGDMYLTMLLQQLTEILYNATLAGYEYFVEGTPEGIIIVIGGYSEKIKLVVENMLEAFVNLELNMDDFTSVLKHLHQIYINELMKPLELAKALRYSILEKNDSSVLERYDELDSITLYELKDFMAEFHQSLFIEGFVIGNMKTTDAEDIGELASKVVKKSINLENLMKPSLLELPTGEYKCSVPTINKDDPNSCVIQYYQQGLGTFINVFLNDMLASAMSEPLFNKLRTEHQVGYNVFCHSTVTHGILGFVVSVESQAKRFKMTNIDDMINIFLKGFEHVLADMSEAKFQDMRANGIASHSPGDADLVDESSRLWGEIAKQTYMFDRSQKDVKAIEQVTLKDLIKWYKTTILGEKKRKLSIMVEGCSTHPDCPRNSLVEQSTVNSIIKGLRTCVPNVAKSWMAVEKSQASESKIGQEEATRYQEISQAHSVATLKNEGPEYITDISRFKSHLTAFPPHEITS